MAPKPACFASPLHGTLDFDQIAVAGAFMHMTRHAILSLALIFWLSSDALAAGGGGGVAGGGRGGTSGPDPNKAYREGVELLQAKDCKKAAKKFRSVLKAVPRNAEANYLRGRALACQGKHKDATRSFKRAIKYDREMYEAYEHLGTMYLALDKSDDAKEQLSLLAQMRSECGETCPSKLDRAYRTLSEGIQGKSTDAPQSFLFENVSESRSAYLEAVERINAGEFMAAVEELRALLQTMGPVPDVLNYLGYAYRNLGRFDESLAYYEQALVLDPEHRGANEYLGELFVELGRMDLAEERLSVLERICPFGCAEFEDLKRRIESRVVAAR